MSGSPRRYYKPKNLGQLHPENDSVFPDYYPPQPNQEEDQMTKDNVQNGFTYTPLIPDESSSRHEDIRSNLKRGNSIKQMNDFMLQCLKKKRHEEDIEKFASITLKRVWLDEPRLQNWLRNIDCPNLSDLIKDGFPYNFGGATLLAELCKRQPTYIRALELIKLAGQSEMANSNHEYTDKWTVTCCDFLQSQIGFVNLDEWRYCAQLSRFQYEEGLVDQRFLKLTLNSLNACTEHTYIAIWLYLVLEFLSIYSGSRTLMRLLIDYLLKKMKEIQNLPTPVAAVPSQNSLAVSASTNAKTNAHQERNDQITERLAFTIKKILWATFVTLPDMYVFPKYWDTYKDVLHKVLFDCRFSNANESSKKNHRSKEEQETLQIWQRVKSRNEFFSDSKEDSHWIDKHLSEDPKGRLFLILDKAGCSTNYKELAAEYFPPKILAFLTSDSEVSFRIQALCYWTVTNVQLGDYRVHVVCTLLSK